MPPEALTYQTRRLAHRAGFGPQCVPEASKPGPPVHGKIDLDFVLIGAQKAGSTFLHQAVEQHPGLFMPVGEIPVFQDPGYTTAGVAWLERLLEEAPDTAMKGIKRPDYLGRPESPGYLASHVAHAKLLVVLREPRARAVSAYFHYMRRGHLPALDPEVGIPLLLDGALDAAWPRAWEVLAFSRYGECLDRYFQTFSRNQIRILIQDEVIEDPQRAVRGVYEFLGVDPSFEPPGLGGRALPTVYSLPRVRFLAWAQKLRSQASSRTAGDHRTPGILGKVAYAGAMALDRTVLKPVLGNQRLPLSDRVMSLLTAYFAFDRERLRHHLGDRVAAWHF